MLVWMFSPSGDLPPLPLFFLPPLPSLPRSRHPRPFPPPWAPSHLHDAALAVHLNTFSALYPSCAPRILPPLPSFRPWGLNKTRPSSIPTPTTATTTNVCLPSLLSLDLLTRQERPPFHRISIPTSAQPKLPTDLCTYHWRCPTRACRSCTCAFSLPRADEFLSTRFSQFPQAAFPPRAELHDDHRRHGSRRETSSAPWHKRLWGSLDNWRTDIARKH